MKKVMLVFILGLVLSACAEDKATERLNFIFILIDDLGYMDVGCNGSTFYETPNINRLASEGMRFTNAYAACPVCSPTRASILTGKYPARLNLTDWLPGRADNPRQKLLRPKILGYIPPEETILPKALKAAGYTTISIGKWHLGGEGHLPDQIGFDKNIAGSHQGSPPSYFSPYKIPTLPDGPKDEYLTDRLTHEAENFIEENKDKPFFLYLPHYAVHNPQQAKKELIKKFESKNRPANSDKTGRENARQVQGNPVYAANIFSADESVGKILAKLDELKITNRTVVIFFSDNGGLSTAEGSPTSNEPLRAGKGHLFEGGIREPLIIKWPGVTKPGSVCDVPVVSTDFYPTLVELAGLKIDTQQCADGVSIAPLLKGGSELSREAIFWHYPHYSNQGNTPGSAVRKGDFKLIEFLEDNHVELYNLKDDLSERKNLAEAMPEKVAELRKLLTDWRKSVSAQMMAPNPNYNPKSKEKKDKDSKEDL